MKRLLFVDDAPEVLETNRQYFQERGYTVDTALGAPDAVSLLANHIYDCIILDIQMPGTNGYALCRYLKERFTVPVIFLTNLSEEECLERGFISGGDDYVIKPYRMRELELRIAARIRNIAQASAEDQGTEKSMLQFGALVLDADVKQAYINQASLKLTLNEFLILYFLAQNLGKPFTQETLYRNIWGEDAYFNTHSIQTLIVRIRKKIAALTDIEYIKTEWRKGYSFVALSQDKNTGTKI